MTKTDSDMAKTAIEKIAVLEVQQLTLIGDKISDKLGLESLTGIEAAQYFLMDRHHWLPSQVKSMSHGDLLFALQEWTREV